MMTPTACIRKIAIPLKSRSNALREYALQGLQATVFRK
jgi:hypothetical protein